MYMAAVGTLGTFSVLRDKRAAKRGARRVPEKTLFWLGFLGGALPMYAAMRLVRHKTRKPAFRIAFPCFVLIHICAAAFLLRPF